jgi:hypothetical protein
MSELSVGQLKGLTVNNNVITVPSGHTIYSPGTVVQVVTGVYTGGEISNSTTTYTDTGLSAAITPKFATSKILVMIDHSVLKNNTNASNSATVRLLRDSTVVKTITSLFSTNSAVENGGAYGFTFVDDPNITASITYKTQFANAVASNVIVHGRGHHGTMTIMEIAT